MRRLVQLCATALQNAYWAFPWSKTLYQGPWKRLCTPGLNCHSCPAAVTACPLGTLQHFLAALRPALRWGTYRLGAYVIGFLLAVGLLLGRFPCGWLCPFGFLQDLLHRLPGPKLALPRRLAGLRFVMLGLLTLALPVLLAGPLGYGEPWYCKLVCPAGTLEAGGMFLLMPDLWEQIGTLFALKLLLLVGLLGWAAVCYRPYCRAVCPLGAIYGICNRWSWLRVAYDPSLCRECGRCLEGCQVELDPRRAGHSAACLRCFDCARRHCPHGALRVHCGARAVPLEPCDPPSTRTC